MKARTPPVTFKQIKRTVYEEVMQQKEDIFKECAADISLQAMMTIFWTLKTRFGWKKKRL